MWLVLLTLACSNRTPPPPAEYAVPVAPAPAPAPAPAAEPATSECYEKCMHDSMARAVAVEVIEADCRAACASQAVVRSAADLALRAGQRVTAEGTLEETLHHGHGPEPYMGTAVRLGDGTLLWVSTGDPPQGFGEWVGKSVHVDGRLGAGEPGDPAPWLLDLGTPGSP